MEQRRIEFENGRKLVITELNGIVTVEELTASGNFVPLILGNLDAAERIAVALLELTGNTVSTQGQKQVYYSYGVNSGTRTAGHNTPVSTIKEWVERDTMGEVNIDKVEERTVITAVSDWSPRLTPKL